MELKEYLRIASERDASDVFVLPGAAVSAKIRGEIVPVAGEVLMPDDTKELVKQAYALAGRDIKRLEKEGDDDFSFPLAGVKKPLSFFLPTIALGVRYAASIARVTRTSMLEVLSQDYMRTAEAKGLARWTVILGHGFRNALIPIITIAGTQLGDIFTGSILIETIFAIPGMGSMLLTAINQRDLPLIEGGVMYIAAICVVVYLVVDILYAVVDPRIRLGGEVSE